MGARREDFTISRAKARVVDHVASADAVPELPVPLHANSSCGPLAKIIAVSGTDVCPQLLWIAL